MFGLIIISYSPLMNWLIIVYFLMFYLFFKQKLLITDSYNIIIEL